MKILLINQEHASFSGPGGAERSVQSIAEYYASQGHETTFVSMARRPYMRDMFESGLHSVRRINGVKTVLLGRPNGKVSHADLIASLVASEAPDIIHTNVFHRAPQLWARLGSFGIPILHTLREYKLICDQNLFDGVKDCGSPCSDCMTTSTYARAMTAHVDGVVGISKFTLSRHLENGFFPNASVKKVIPNSYRPRHSVQERELGREVGRPLRIGFLGRMHASKGINLIIDAFSQVKPEGISLIMAGDLQDQGIAQRVDELSRSHQAEYIGFVNPADFFPQIDVLLAPSIWHEPFGRITIEAFAHWVPVITTNRGGLPDIVTHEQTGWVFDPDDPAALVRLLEELKGMDSSSLARMRARCAHEAENYAPELVGSSYVETYQELIESKRKAERPFLGKLRNVLSRDAQRIDLPRKLKTNISVRNRRPLKVMIVTGEFPKLSETFVLNHITGLIDLGQDVRILHTRQGRPDQVPVDYAKYALHRHSTLFEPDNQTQEIVKKISKTAKSVFSKVQNLDDESAPALREIKTALSSYEENLIDLKLAEKIAEAAKDVDVVHCHFGHRPRMLFKYIELGAFHAPVVCSFHGIDVSGHIERMGPTLYDDIKGKLHKALPVSDFFAKRLVDLGFDQKDVQVHRVGIDLSRFRYADHKRQMGERLRLVSVGRLVEKKGIEFAIRAVAAVRESRPDLDFDYTIVGEGPLGGACSTLIQELQLADHVKMVGAQPHDKVRDLLGSAHAMLVPSVTASDGDMEGIPTVTMEAMATGLPVVSTYHSGIPEAVVDGVTGLLSPEKDFIGFANNIQRLYDDPDLGSQLGRNGRVHVDHSFNIARQNKKVLDLYRRIAFGEED